MSKLIRANFARLWKSTVFWLCMGFSAGLCLFIIIVRFMDMKQNPEIYASLCESYKNIDGLIFVGGIYILFAVAVFIGIFIGTEYSDGTIRNKLIIGNSRGAIYLSNLIVCCAASIMIQLAFIILMLSLGSIFLGCTTMSFTEILAFTLAGSAATIALTSILLFFSMLIRSKAVGSVVALIGTILMLFITMTVFQRLAEPEYIEAYSYTIDDGDLYIDDETEGTITSVKEKNPRYLTGAMRDVYEFLNDFIPTSQHYQIVMNESADLGLMLFFDGIILIVMSVAGMIVFRKRDLK